MRAMKNLVLLSGLGGLANSLDVGLLDVCTTTTYVQPRNH